MNNISPVGIVKIADILQKAAMEQTADDLGVSIEELPALMESDVSVAYRVKVYIGSAYNFSISKL